MFGKRSLVVGAIFFLAASLPAYEDKIFSSPRCNEVKVSVIKSLIDPDTILEFVEFHYPLEAPLKVSLLSIGVNDMYLVEAGEERYVARLSRVEKYHTLTQSEYLFELEWLDFLRHQGVALSYPIRRGDNQFYGLIEAPEGPRYLTLFSYAEGTTEMDLEQASILGRTLAQLHLASDQFETDLDRPHLDVQNMIDRPLQQIKEFLGEGDEKCVLLEVLGEELKRKIAGLEVGEGSYGIIAGDVHGFNQHFTADNQVTLFDFEFCAYGYRIYDLATFRWSRGSDDVELWNAFLEGYQSGRHLTSSELERIETFVNARNLWWIGFMIELPEHRYKLNEKFWEKALSRFYLPSD